MLVALSMKYLKQKLSERGLQFYWYQFEYYTVFFIFLAVLLIIYGVYEIFGMDYLGEMQVISMRPEVALVYWLLTGILVFFVVFNRKSILLIGDDGIIQFRKRAITSSVKKFCREEIIRIDRKLQTDWGESTTGLSSEIYDLIIILRNNRKIKLGSFNEEDCRRLEKELV